MKIDVSGYEVKKYYVLNDRDSGDEVVEFTKPKEVFFDNCDYLALGEEDWKNLKSRLGITKSDDEVTFEDVVREYDGLSDLAVKMELEGLLYQVSNDEPQFVDEIMEDAYIIFWVNRDDQNENDVIRVYKGEELTSCYYGVCHQPFIDKFWSFGDDYYEVEYYELDCVEHIRTNYRNVDVYLILEPDNKEERLRVLRRDCSNDQNSYWEYVVMSVDHYNKYHADEDDDE